MRSFWGGALGLTQFLPSRFYRAWRRLRLATAAPIFSVRLPDAPGRRAAKRLLSKGCENWRALGL